MGAHPPSRGTGAQKKKKRRKKEKKKKLNENRCQNRPFFGAGGGSDLKVAKTRQPIRTNVPHLGQLKTTGHGSLDVNNGSWRAFESVPNCPRRRHVLNDVRFASPIPPCETEDCPNPVGERHAVAPTTWRDTTKCERYAVVRMPRCDPMAHPQIKCCP